MSKIVSMPTPLPKTRDEALKAGAPRYHTGKPCKNGHIADRFTWSAACSDCQAAYRNGKLELYRRLRIAQED